MRAVGDGIVYVSEGWYAQPETYEAADGKGFKKVLKIVAPIVIGFVAGPIAGALAKTFGLGANLAAGTLGASLGRIGGSALVGGVLNKAVGGTFLGGAVAGGIGAAGAGGAARFNGGIAGFGGAGAPAAVGLNTATATSFGPGTVPLQGVSSAPIGGAAAAGGTAAATTFTQRLAGLPAEIGKKLFDSDVILRLASNGLAATLAGATTDEERALINQRNQELQELKSRNLDQYNFQVGVAKKLLAQADAYDPQRYALAASSDQQQKTAALEDRTLRQIQAQGGGRRTGLATEASRKINIDGSVNATNAYYNAYGDATTRRTGLYTAAANAFPTYNDPASGQALSELQAREEAEAKRRAAAGYAFGSILGAKKPEEPPLVPGNG